MLIEQIKWASTSMKARIAACFIMGAMVLSFHAPALDQSTGDLLGLAAYVLNGHVSPWLVAGLSLMLLWSSRHELWARMHRSTTLPYVFFGAALIFISVSLPWYAAAVIGVFGVFCILFGRASRLILPGVIAYAIVLLFPLVINSYAESAYAGTVIGPLAWIVQLLRLPVEVVGSNISLILPSSEELNVAVAAACAGPTTMALFLSIFTLMYSYRPIRGQTGLMVLLVGITGTWLQNVIRVVVVVVIGHFFGEDSLWAAHEYLSYLLFPLWYLMFTALYISVANQEQVESPYALSLVPVEEHEQIYRTR